MTRSSCLQGVAPIAIGLAGGAQVLVKSAEILAKHAQILETFRTGLGMGPWIPNFVFDSFNPLLNVKILNIK
jgi:hypothetical protein